MQLHYRTYCCIPVVRVRPAGGENARGRQRRGCLLSVSVVAYELYAGVVEDADAGGREVGADEQLVAAEVGAEVRQRGLGAEVLADDVGDVEPVGEPPRGQVRGEVDPVGRRVGPRRGHEVVVVAVVHEGVPEHEEGARRRGGRGPEDEERRHRGDEDGHEQSSVHCAWRGRASLARSQSRSDD
jgi:hypothetical protein|uniref:Uncharacterized protein n=1 Tax=Zea mays TaxID=4577 RepID=C0PKM3_MAIZE|nr:unknown [Zea mays]